MVVSLHVPPATRRACTGTNHRKFAWRCGGWPGQPSSAAASTAGGRARGGIRSGGLRALATLAGARRALALGRRRGRRRLRVPCAEELGAFLVGHLAHGEGAVVDL